MTHYKFLLFCILNLRHDAMLLRCWRLVRLGSCTVTGVWVVHGYLCFCSYCRAPKRVFINALFFTSTVRRFRLLSTKCCLQSAGVVATVHSLARGHVQGRKVGPPAWCLSHTYNIPSPHSRLPLVDRGLGAYNGLRLRCSSTKGTDDRRKDA